MSERLVSMQGHAAFNMTMAHKLHNRARFQHVVLYLSPQYSVQIMGLYHFFPEEYRLRNSKHESKLISYRLVIHIRGHKASNDPCPGPEKGSTNTESINLTNLERSKSFRVPNRPWRPLQWHWCAQSNRIQSSLRKSNAFNPRKTVRNRNNIPSIEPEGPVSSREFQASKSLISFVNFKELPESFE
ncbi:hypothetical protein VNO77_19033 [Canavalia gladiata]|uniref:Uncharacterized protein n=1 Tax=Canavalia gladiata TaxID=3824 RepID=A0AAN9LQA0_CANGL